MRLTFPLPTDIFTVSLLLNGVYVYIKPSNRDLALVTFASISIPLQVSPSGPIRFHIKHLPELLFLPENVIKQFVGDLASIWQLVITPPINDPVTITKDSKNIYTIKWYSKNMSYAEEITNNSLVGFVNLNINFIAKKEVLNDIASLGINYDGLTNIEYNIDRYYSVKSATLPDKIINNENVIFRINSSTYGIPMTNGSKTIENGEAITIYGKSRKLCSISPETVSDKLPHIQLSAAEKISNLISGPGGVLIEAGKAVNVRSALLDLLTVVSSEQVHIVCTPHTILLWAAILRKSKKSFCVHNNMSCEHEFKVLLYSDFKNNKNQTEVVVYDFADIALKEATTEEIRLYNSASSVDTIRFGILSSEGADQNTLNKVMTVLRPSEFNSEHDISYRYLGNKNDDFNRHIDLYKINIASPGDQPEIIFKTCIVDEETEDTPSKQKLANLTCKDEVIHAINSGGYLTLSEKMANFIEEVYNSESEETFLYYTQSKVTHKFVSSLLNKINIRGNHQYATGENYRKPIDTLVIIDSNLPEIDYLTKLILGSKKVVILVSTYKNELDYVLGKKINDADILSI